ncbi:NAD(P)H dehydrogenase [Solihabitans fulvus]|uniref:FMN dependent NADH:quinone oxidoreductase n=1 Tax=Solihabitans fulvus TaxID=1892852 RepID=A0A5B2XDY8_9PSEU|nr:NAD(P)H-dependent oxidoreductase [Solihabitans fulvus]KAA2261315.1 NAD(P)H dehydrogenase [Solihabitans fulvus]
MPNLLHLDASIRQEKSVSREVSAAFAAQWREVNPEGGYTYRDLGLHPVPHVDLAHHQGQHVAPDERSAEQRASWAITEPLVAEVRWADVILLGLPMYNYAIPSSVKAWIDRISIHAHFADRVTGRGVLTGTRVVVASARGGSYAPGTPRAGLDFQEPYLRGVFGTIGLGEHLQFVHTEMTMAGEIPELAEFRTFAANSLANAHRTVRELAAAEPIEATA